MDQGEKPNWSDSQNSPAGGVKGWSQSMEPLLLKIPLFIQDQLQFLERTVTKIELKKKKATSWRIMKI